MKEFQSLSISKFFLLKFQTDVNLVFQINQEPQAAAVNGSICWGAVVLQEATDVRGGQTIKSGTVQLLGQYTGTD